MVIDNLKPLKDRNDVGCLWENFLMVERMKKLGYSGQHPSKYYWRTYSGTEIDYVEEGEGKLSGYEFKYSEKVKKAPKLWQETYDNSDYQVINRTNWLEFVK